MATAGNIYDVGDEVILRSTFANESGTPTNPTSVTVEVLAPDGTTVVNATTTLPAPPPPWLNPSPGEVRYVVAPPLDPGRYTFRFVGTGAIVSEEAGAFAVKPWPGGGGTATYSGDPSASSVDETRFLMGDNRAPFLLSDEEVLYMVGRGGGVYQGAILGLQRLITRYSSGLTSKSVGPLSLAWGNRVKDMQATLAALRHEALLYGEGMAPIPYAGGISLADKAVDDQDPDIEHAFKVGQMDAPGGVGSGDLTQLSDRERWG